jgi:hypothetical protein
MSGAQCSTCSRAINVTCTRCAKTAAARANGGRVLSAPGVVVQPSDVKGDDGTAVADAGGDGTSTLCLMTSAAGFELAAKIAAAKTSNNELCFTELTPPTVPKTVFRKRLAELSLAFSRNIASTKGSFGDINFLEYAQKDGGTKCHRVFVLKKERVAARPDKQFVEAAVLARLTELGRWNTHSDYVRKGAVWPFPYVFESWTCGEDCYLLMQLIVGRTLHAEFEALHASIGFFFERTVFPLRLGAVTAAIDTSRVLFRAAMQSCLSLDTYGFVHGDLHPGNVIISHVGGGNAIVASIIDFGQTTQPGDVAPGTNFAQLLWQGIARGLWPTQFANALLQRVFNDDDEYIDALYLNRSANGASAAAAPVYTYGRQNFTLWPNYLPKDASPEQLDLLRSEAPSDALLFPVPAITESARSILYNGDVFDAFYDGAFTFLK